jgi:peptide/nickel transport system substrate-binding protein
MSRVGKFAILGALAALVVSAGTTGAARQDHRGGTLKLLAKAAAGTLDPQVNYTLQYWQLYQATYDGLLGFTKAGGDAAFTVVPDLAESLPQATNGG